jgi:hypothetical protein
MEIKLKKPSTDSLIKAITEYIDEPSIIKEIISRAYVIENFGECKKNIDIEETLINLNTGEETKKEKAITRAVATLKRNRKQWISQGNSFIFKPCIQVFTNGCITYMYSSACTPQKNWVSVHKINKEEELGQLIQSFEFNGKINKELIIDNI